MTEKCPKCGGTGRMLAYVAKQKWWVQVCWRLDGSGCGHEFPLDDRSRALRDSARNAHFVNPERFLTGVPLH